MEFGDFDELDEEFLIKLEDLTSAAENQYETASTNVKIEKKEPNQQHLETLARYFGHKEFRPLQWEIISAIIEDRRDVCAIMVTGYGKSLCFQYPSLFSGGITIVISPLISLMEDQILSLQVSNISACLLGSAQTQQAQVIEEIFDEEYKIVYLTPEFCTGDYGSEILKRMAVELQITLIAVDEAHCISTWGHDFRFQYRKLSCLRNIFTKVPIIAVTATATTKVRDDICNSLKLRNPLVVCSGFDRPNLYFEVNQKGHDGVFKDLSKVMIFNKSLWKFSGSTIIYCITRKQTEEVAEILKHNGMKCLPYHAGLSLTQRSEAHEQFLRDKIEVIVATIAFGMGIDKPDIRNIIHYGASKSLENYYQEVGRAGRDGLPAKCITFYSNADFATLRNIQSHSSSTVFDDSKLKLMESYLTTRQCRRRFILNHFENKSEESNTPQANCCDNCTNKRRDHRSDNEKYEGLDENGCYDFTRDAQLLLETVSLMKNFGLTMYILFLRGSKSAKIPKHYYNHRLYGSGKNQSEDWWKALAKILIEKKYLKETLQRGNGYSFCRITISDEGVKFLSNIQNAKLLLPPPSNILKLLKTKSQGGSGWLSSTNSKINQSSTSKQQIQENQDDINQRMKLYHRLLDVRATIAKQLDCMPYTIASNTAIMQMSKTKPKNLDEMRILNLDGFTEFKLMKFGERFLEIINKESSCLQSIEKKSSIKEIMEFHMLSGVSEVKLLANMASASFKSGLTIEKIASDRKVSLGVVMKYLAAGIKMGYPIKLSELGITPEYRDIVINVVKKYYTGDVRDFANVKLNHIKNHCPPDITTDHIKIVLAYLELRCYLEKKNIAYEEFEDFSFKELGFNVDGNEECNKLDMFIDYCSDMLEDKNLDSSDFEPPAKKEKFDFDNLAILDSPPRQYDSNKEDKNNDCDTKRNSAEIVEINKSCDDVNSAKKTKKKVLPPWLVTKKIT